MSRKIVLIAPGSVGHTVKWLNGFADRNFDVHLITQHKPDVSINQRVKVHILPFSGIFGYFANAYSLRKIVKKLSPDIINVHYATGYGILSMMSRIKPYVLSVWGSDVYVDPFKSIFHKFLIIKSLKYASHIASTSYDMAEQTRRLLKEKHKEISITPFGVDMSLFCANKEVFSSERVNIGIAKALEAKYGIDILIKGFALAISKMREMPGKQFLQLNIAGDGSQRHKLESLVEELDIQRHVVFWGHIQNRDVASFINNIDIFTITSHVESFGVAAVEASACERPCIVTNVGGLPEVVVDGETGLIIKPNSPEALSQAIITLVQQPEIAKEIGRNGREYVLNIYSQEAALDTMFSVFETYL